MNNYGNETQKFFSRIKRLTLNRENFVPRKFPNIRYYHMQHIKLTASTFDVVKQHMLHEVESHGTCCSTTPKI